jgi:hypothetical protein
MTDIPLDPAEWDFSTISESERLDAWNWEAAREIDRDFPGTVFSQIDPYLGSRLESEGVWPLPYTKLAQGIRKFIFWERGRKRRLPVREVSAIEAQYLAEDFEGVPHSDVHCFYFSEVAKKSEIMKFFQKWVDDFYPSLEAKKPPGRKNDALAWLCDLSIYRCKIHGYTAKQSQHLLQWIKVSRRSGSFSSSHYADAGRITKRRLLQRRTELLKRSNAVGRVKNAFMVLDYGTNPFI